MKQGRFHKVFGFRFQRMFAPTVAVVALILILVAWLQPQTVVRKQILLGTFVQIKVYGNGVEQMDRAVSAAFAEIQRVQRQFSRAGDGLLGRLNQAPPGSQVQLSEELWRLLEQAQQINALSQGSFDVTMGALQDLWGFVEDWQGEGTVPSNEQIDTWLQSPRGVLLKEGQRAARLSEATQVDLGGIAKGYAVDRAVEVLKQHSIQAGLVDAGGNVRVFGRAPGTLQTWFQARPFLIGVQHPRDLERLLGGLTMGEDQAVATSGDYQRFFEVDGVRYHHILNPHTGRPARQLIQCTILAPTAVEADALSTAVFVMGPKAGLEWVERLPGVEAVLVAADGEVLASSGLEASGFIF